jgi:hypothetical protein
MFPFHKEKWSLHSFFTTVQQQADVAGNILLFFYKKKWKQNKKNNKILPATLACCGAVVRNECSDHFSIIKQWLDKSVIFNINNIYHINH